MSMDHQDQVVFKSGLLSVMNYRCDGRDTQGEESSLQPEIVLPRAGAYQRRDAQGIFLADPNQVLFFNPGEPFEITHPIRGGDSSTVFLFAPSLLLEILRMWNPNVENDPQRLFHHSHITLDARLQIIQHWLLHLNPLQLDPLQAEERSILFLSEIIKTLYHQRPVLKRHSSPKTLNAYVDQTRAVKVFINSHIHSRLQLEKISAAVHLSPYHLCRIFKQNTGMTIHRYVQRLRLSNAAERMLSEPRARLDVLAFEYGFSNHAHFSAAFRQMFGINPSDFRRMSKNLSA